MEKKEKIIIAWKQVGETPLECISRIRNEGILSKETKATYAGRLDPMAEGVLVILTDETVHEKEVYLGLDKVYKVEVLFGIATDTGDVLGKIKETVNSNLFGEEKIKKILVECQGVYTEQYPAYSSKTIDGKPSFSFARAGSVAKRPTHRVRIDSIVLENLRMMSTEKIVENILMRIAKVKGDFRQREICSLWKAFSVDYANEKFCVATIIVTCGSGAYMRVLAEKIGKLLDIPALAFGIVRTQVGNFR